MFFSKYVLLVLYYKINLPICFCFFFEWIKKNDLCLGPWRHWYFSYDSFFDFLSELARDALQRTGNFKVIAGIISPVSDKYDRKVG